MASAKRAVLGDLSDGLADSDEERGSVVMVTVGIFFSLIIVNNP